MKRIVQCVSGVTILAAAVLVGLNASSSPAGRSGSNTPHVTGIATAQFEAISQVVDPDHGCDPSTPTPAPATNTTTAGITLPGIAIPESEYVSSSTHLPGGIIMNAPTTCSQLPEISQQTAIADAIKDGWYWVSVSSAHPTAYYGIMTDTGVKTVPPPPGESIAAGNIDLNKVAAELSAGEATLVFQNVPTWIIEFTGPTIPATGGLPPPGVAPVTTATMAGPTTQRIDIFMNADTGAVMFG